MEGKLLDLRGNEAWSRGVVEGTRNKDKCTSKRETGMTKDREIYIFYFKRTDRRGLSVDQIKRVRTAWMGRAGLGTG
jgi:hypothetical protein